MSPAALLPPHYDELALRKLIDDWKDTKSEAATAQSFFRELCRALGVDEPTKGKPNEAYRFEKPVPVPEGVKLKKKKADVYREGMFVWENKSFERTKTGGRPSRWIDWMREAYEQAKRYGRFLADQSPNGARPPLLIVCDVGRDIWIWNTFATGDYGTFEDRMEISMGDLVRPVVFQKLQWALSDPQRLNPYRESGRVTLAIAKSLGKLVDRIEKRLGTGLDGEINESIARFMMACIFTIFAEDMQLLDKPVFTEDLSRRWQERPALFAPEVDALWKLMNTGGNDRQLGNVLEFNGGLFRDCPVIALEADEIRELAIAANYDWTEVEPSIFGTLLEQSLKSHERSRLGAHFTPREYIERIVRPTIVEPLREEWQIANAAAVKLAVDAKSAKEAGQEKEARALLKEARQHCYAFLERLRNVRVLDPACGTGNFLYVSLDLIKRIEKEVLVALRDLGETHEQMTAVLVQPDQFFGIEKKPWAKEITELVLWIGYLQWWRRERGKVRPPAPVLRQYGNIEARDAVLASDPEEDVLDKMGRPVLVTRQGKKGESTEPSVLKRYPGAQQAKWPDVDFIVSNPPFIGNKRMRDRLGDGYAEAIRDVYSKPNNASQKGANAAKVPVVPGDVDYVAYWWHKAAMKLREPKSRLRRFGFITTNSIRQRQSGAVLREHIGDELVLHFACPDHPWVDPSEELGSAAVRISMTVVRRASEQGARAPLFVEDLDSKRDPRAAARKLVAAVNRGHEAYEDGALEVQLGETRGQTINPDLTVGANVTDAKPLLANGDLCFQGMNLVGEGFRLTREEAVRLVKDLTNRPSVLRRYILGRDLKEAPVERYVIDFYGLDEEQAQLVAPTLFNHVVRTVKKPRSLNSRSNYRDYWWIFGEARPGLRRAIEELPRYIATVETSKYRFFVMLDSDIVPDHKLYAIASDDYYVLGVLSSIVHTEWALRAGGSLEDRPTWTNTTTFLRFPFPDATEKQKKTIRSIAERLDAARAAILTEHSGVSITDLYNVVAVLRARRDNPNEAIDLSQEDETHISAWRCDTLLLLHDELDAAVLAAYGLRADISTDDLLQQLVTLNLARAEGEAKGTIKWLRPAFQEPLWKKRTGAIQVALPQGAVQEDSEAKRPKWPIGDDRESIRAQVAVLRDVLGRAGRPLTVDEITAGIAKPPRIRLTSAVEKHLQTLEVVGAFVSTESSHGEVWSLAY